MSERVSERTGERERGERNERKVALLPLEKKIRKTWWNQETRVRNIVPSSIIEWMVERVFRFTLEGFTASTDGERKEKKTTQ